MKMYGSCNKNGRSKLALTFCVVQSCCVGTSNAFFVSKPASSSSSMMSSSLVSNPTKTALHSFSYLGKDGEDAPAQTTSNNPQGVRPSAGSPSMDSSLTTPKGANSGPPAKSPQANSERPLIQELWDNLTPTTVQGGSLRTWSFQDASVDRVQVFLKTEGRPLNADIDLWQGPDNAPEKMRVYLEDGSVRTFSAVIETPRGHNAVAIRNTGHLEFPLQACVEANLETIPVKERLSPQTKQQLVQGGAIKTYPFSPFVENVLVLLTTDGRPLNARIELLQGPNNNKQVVEIYTEDGRERPFFIVIETPGIGNVVRIVNTAPVEFPMTVAVESYPFETTPQSGDTVKGPGPVWEQGGNSFLMS